MHPYRIHCLTCNAPLKVHDASLVGQILNCPKCHSMVLITPPVEAVIGPAVAPPVKAGRGLGFFKKGAKPAPAATDLSSAAPPTARVPGATPQDVEAGSTGAMPQAPLAVATPAPSAAAPPVIAHVPSQTPAPTPTPATPVLGDTPAAIPPGTFAPAPAGVHNEPAPPIAAAAALAVPPAPPVIEIPAEKPPVRGPSSAAATAASVATAGLTAAAPAWRNWAILGASGVGGALLTLCIWFMLSPGGHGTKTVPTQSTAKTTPKSSGPHDAAGAKVSTPTTTPADPAAPQKTIQPDDAASIPIKPIVMPQTPVRAEPVKPAAPAEPPVADPPAPAVPAADANAAKAPPPADAPPAANQAANSNADAINPAPAPAEVRDEGAAPPAEPPVPRAGSLAEPAPQRPLPPPTHDAMLKLSTPIAEMKLPPTRLKLLLSTLGDMAGVTIVCDAAALAQAGVTPDDLLAVEAKQSTIGDMLKQALATKGLGLVTAGDLAVVTLLPPGEAPLKRVRYLVDDLAIDATTDAKKLAELMQQLTPPESWESHGGRGTLEVADKAVVVTQTPDVQWQILLLCEKLRIARHLPPRSRLDSSRFALTSRKQLAAATLAKPITMHSAEKATLGELVTQLAGRTETSIELDPLALLRVGAAANSPARLNVDNVPLNKALDELLAPLGLTYRVLSTGQINITTPAVVSAGHEVEFYPAGRLARDAAGGRALAKRVEEEAAPKSWATAGGQGVTAFDAISACLLVRQTQPVQGEVEAALVRWQDR
ncbi:MAG: STN domain-containing protein [Planctomycetia bacterium]|nr:STN domain-containing protein [Planctomycetia bacterium]